MIAADLIVTSVKHVLIKKNGPHSNFSHNQILCYKKTKKVLSIEENSEIGGLSSILPAIYLSKDKVNIKFKSIALKDIVHNSIGSQDHLKKLNNLDIDSISKKMIKYINEKY